MPRHSLFALTGAILFALACSCGSDDAEAPPAELPEVTAAAPAAPRPVAGYYTAKIAVDPTTSYEVGLTVAPDEKSAEMVTLFDPANPWSGYTHLGVERDGDAVNFVLAGHTGSDGAEHEIPRVKAGDRVLTLTPAGEGWSTTWGSFNPTGAQAAGFQPAEPEVLGP